MATCGVLHVCCNNLCIQRVTCRAISASTELLENCRASSTVGKQIFDEHICLSVCLSAGISQEPHVQTSPDQSINQSIKIYFLSNRNITVYTVHANAQKAAREAYAH